LRDVASPLPEREWKFKNDEFRGPLDASDFCECVVSRFGQSFHARNQFVQMLETFFLEVKNLVFIFFAFSLQQYAPTRFIPEFGKESFQTGINRFQIHWSHVGNTNIHVVGIKITVVNRSLPPFADTRGYPFGFWVESFFQGLNNPVLVRGRLFQREVFPRGGACRFALVEKTMFDGYLICFEEFG